MSAWGIRKAVGRAGPPKDGPKLGAVFSPLGGLCLSAVHLRREAEGIQ